MQTGHLPGPNSVVSVKAQEAIDATLPITAVVNVAPRFDAAIIGIYQEALKLLGYAEQRDIEHNDDLAPTTNDLSLISKLKKAIEEKRKEYVTPLREHLDNVNAAFKELTAPLVNAESINKQLILAYNERVRAARAEAELIDRLAQEVAERQAAQNGGAFDVDLTPVDKPEAAPSKTNTESGAAGMRDNWKWELVDKSQVPMEYLMINAGMLTPVVKASKGAILIPGIRVFNEPIIAVTTK